MSTAPIKATTQRFTEIEDIQENIILFADGGASLIIEVSAVNFELLSEKEQEAIIYSYNAFLNSLSFPIQILVVSRQMDVSLYLNFVLKQQEKLQAPRFKPYLEKYYHFIQSVVKENTVLEKKFYIAIPFSPLELGVKAGASLLSHKQKRLPFSKDYILSRAKTALFPKRDHLLRQLGKLGLKSQHLSTSSLVELFYEFYNPEQEERQKISEATAYSNVLVGGLKK